MTRETIVSTGGPNRNSNREEGHDLWDNRYGKEKVNKTKLPS